MQEYDLIIIGGGSAGLSAAMYGTRLGLKTLTFAEMPGGLITTTHLVENWPGIKSISGPDLGMSLYEHAISTGATIKTEKATKVYKLDECFYKVISGSSEYKAKSILFATGTVHKKLGIPGEKEFENKGLSFCALCDGAFYKNKTVGIVGGGDSAVKEALFLSEHALKVIMFVRKDILRAEPINIKNLEANPKIEVRYNTEVLELIGKEKLDSVKLSSGEILPIDGVFYAIGHNAQTDIAKELGVELNERAEIIINRKTETNLPRVYAAGDCNDTGFKQAITGSAEGVTAAYYAYLACNENACYKQK
ncbi:MAG: FAD-dependent oxidoreductase [Candidatus Gracilibacteria bacterium]|jgi:thioredoxin reductase (NADPH)|nr:FAD-dependent oxidoreductase [Candidatus Gracilibacteria bacterium]